MSLDPRADSMDADDDTQFVSLWTLSGLFIIACVWLITWHFAPLDRDAFDRARDVSRAQDIDARLRCRLDERELRRRATKTAPGEPCPLPRALAPAPAW